MQLYQPTITGSLSVSGSINLSGSITIAGGGTISGTASIATNAITASSADNFLVRNTLTAQTLVVQTITSSVDFVTGSTRFGSILGNTHVFTGSVLVTGSVTATEGNFLGGGVDGSLGSVVRISSTNTNGNARNWAIVNTFESYGDLNFRLSTAQGGNALVSGSTIMTLNRSGNVGIGTSTIYSGAKLHILGGILAVEPTNGNTNSEILIGRGLSSLGTSAGSGITAKVNFAFEGSNDNFYQELGFVTTTANQTRANSAADFYISTKAAGASSPSEKFRITSGGNVGIGTTGPSTLLHINTTARTSGTNVNVITLSDTVTGVQTSGYGVRIVGTSNNGSAVAAIAFEADGGTNNDTAIALYTQSTAGALTRRVTINRGGQLRITQAANGHSGDGLSLINTANEIWNFVNGGDSNLYFGFQGNSKGVFAYTTGTYTALSDINKKKDFEQSTLGLNSILGLKPTLFRMKDEDESTEKHLGFIAQEVKEFIPQAYTESINGEETFIGLNYNAIVAALVKAVQEQNQTIQNLQEQINILAK